MNDTEGFSVVTTHQWDTGTATHFCYPGHWSLLFVSSDVLFFFLPLFSEHWVWFFAAIRALPSPHHLHQTSTELNRSPPGAVESWHTYESIASVTKGTSTGSLFCSLSYPLQDASLLTGSSTAPPYLKRVRPIPSTPLYFLSL